MGKGGDANNKAMELSAETGRELVGLAKTLQTQSAPWRTAAGDAYTSILNDPSKAVAPATNSLARSTASALSQAREMQPGGLRDRTERDLNMNLMTGKAQLLNQGYMDAANALGNLGVGTTQQSIGAYGGANNSAQALSQIGQSQKAGLGGGAAGFGALLGGL